MQAGTPTEAACETVCMNCSSTLCWCFCVFYPSDSGRLFPVKVETDKGRLYQTVTLQEFRRPGASGAGRGLKGRKPCFLTCLCHAGCCSVYTLGVCGRREGKACLLNRFSGRLLRCLKKVMFYFWQNLAKSQESNSFLVGFFWKGEIQNVLFHLL